MRGFRFLEMRGGCGCTRVCGFPILFLFFLRSITRPLAREEERLAHIAELAGGRPEAEEKAQEREKNGTSGVHGGGYFAPHDTNNIFWTFIYVRSTREHLRTAHHLPDGWFASRGALVHSSSYFCLSHARTFFSCGAPCCNPAHRGGMGSGG
jgi:hypothetical protein